MTRSTPLMLLLAASFSAAALPAVAAAPAATQQPASAGSAPVLVTAAQWQQMRSDGTRYPVFTKEQQRAERLVRGMIKAGIDVPVPKDKGGGYTHEQHKRNYQAIQAAGALYRLTGDKVYANYARDLLLGYAKLYPGLGAHPQGRGQIPGRLFWQTLNDSVWLVSAVQGYDAIRDSLSAADRKTIDDNVFRPMADFLSGTPENFDKIHNHATWAVAAVGMTGYVLRDPTYVDKR